MVVSGPRSTPSSDEAEGTSAASPAGAAELASALETVARAPVLLVASDYDGTLAPIVADPEQARPVRESLVAMRALASMARTHAALISGRSLAQLARLTGDPRDVHLVGSHGSEFEPDFASTLSPEAAALRRQIGQELERIAQLGPGLLVEHKPGSVALHFRQAEPELAARALAAVEAGPAALPGVLVKHGKMVVELGVVPANKGTALETIRHRVGATAALFIGDDVTDEDAFATLRGPDVGIKVGPGETQAAYRIGDTTDVARVLARVAELRAAWLAGAEAVPIDQLAMLSDQRTAALVSPTARIVYFCAPRIDSPTLLGELLGGPSAGYFAIIPAGQVSPPSQQYLGNTFILQSRWPGLVVTDYLDGSGGRPMQRAGRVDLIRVVEGTGRVVVEFAPRLDFGRIPTRLMVRDGGLEVEGAIDPIVLFAPGVAWRVVEQGPHQTAIAELELHQQTVVLELRYGTGSLRPAVEPEPERRRQTERLWSGWASRLHIPPLRADLVRRSALVLKGLCHGPTGAIVAAATTSLPEHIGGVRNWDYRYCWPRDAAMAATALARLGSTAEGLRFLDWLLGVVDRCCESADRLAPLYTVAGSDLGPEAEISELAGYCGSRPVRVGNAAARQVQLDVFGPIVELVAVLLERGAPLSTEHWRLVEAMVAAVEHRWREPDHGIWELRLPKQHHVHSKVMGWLTADRAARIAEQLLGRPRDDFLALRDAIARDVLEHGWNERLGAFTATYDNGETDAAVLAIGLSGLLPPDDPRFLRTVDAVERQLRLGPTVYRYHYDDGLPGFEGGFHLCTSWLIEAYALTGRCTDAEQLFEQFASLAGPTGLLSEQYDPTTRRALGNHPQVYSHVGLINAALRLTSAC